MVQSCLLTNLLVRAAISYVRRALYGIYANARRLRFLAYLYDECATTSNVVVTPCQFRDIVILVLSKAYVGESAYYVVLRYFQGSKEVWCNGI